VHKHCACCEHAVAHNTPSIATSTHDTSALLDVAGQQGLGTKAAAHMHVHAPPPQAHQTHNPERSEDTPAPPRDAHPHHATYPPSTPCPLVPAPYPSSPPAKRDVQLRVVMCGDSPGRDVYALWTNVQCMISSTPSNSLPGSTHVGYELFSCGPPGTPIQSLGQRTSTRAMCELAGVPYSGSAVCQRLCLAEDASVCGVMFRAGTHVRQVSVHFLDHGQPPQGLCQILCRFGSSRPCGGDGCVPLMYIPCATDTLDMCVACLPPSSPTFFQVTDAGIPPERGVFQRLSLGTCTCGACGGPMYGSVSLIACAHVNAGLHCR
jgi:hypothetical protein